MSPQRHPPTGKASGVRVTPNVIDTNPVSTTEPRTASSQRGGCGRLADADGAGRDVIVRGLACHRTALLQRRSPRQLAPHATDRPSGTATSRPAPPPPRTSEAPRPPGRGGPEQRTLNPRSLGRRAVSLLPNQGRAARTPACSEVRWPAFDIQRIESARVSSNEGIGPPIWRARWSSADCQLASTHGPSGSISR